MDQDSFNLSLDDIIKKNNLKRGNNATRGRVQSASSNKKGFPSRNSQSNGKETKNTRRPLQNKDRSEPRASFAPKKSGGVIDARLKIIQKNRQRLIDARDKLSELAKRTDARDKLKSRSQEVRPRPEIRQRSEVRQRPEIRRERVQEPRNKFFGATSQKPMLLQRSIRNNVSNIRDTNSLFRCTINRPVVQPYEEEMEVDTPSPIRQQNNFSGIKIVTPNDYLQYRQDYLPSPQQPIYVDHYEPPSFPTRQLQPPRELAVQRSGVRMSQEMRARLDTPARTPQYSVPQAQQSLPFSQGHRIVVSNLHSSVTHEDIKELFEDIGPLLTSRLVRPGTAEVIYKIYQDAKKAVEAYHNRQLDGQPMKCLLVNPRLSAGSSGVLRSNNMAALPKYPVSSKSMVVPDISAIHKALFTYK